jgi:hypothetical protein
VGRQYFGRTTPLAQSPTVTIAPDGRFTIPHALVRLSLAHLDRDSEGRWSQGAWSSANLEATTDLAGRIDATRPTRHDHGCEIVDLAGHLAVTAAGLAHAIDLDLSKMGASVWSDPEGTVENDGDHPPPLNAIRFVSVRWARQHDFLWELALERPLYLGIAR